MAKALRDQLSTATTLAASVYERMRADVLVGNWTPGQKLGIESLREHYETGATPLREALNRLAAEGLVKHLDQRGFIAAPVSGDALRELTTTRVWLDGLAVEQGIAAKTPAWEESVVLALHRLAKLPRSLLSERYEENPEWERLHRAFHMALIAHSGSRWLTAFCEQLYDQAYRYRQLAMKTSYRVRDELAEHRAIVEAVVAGDAAVARQAVALHFGRTADIIGQAS